MSSLNVGDPAPDFTRQAVGGRMVTLSEFRNRSAVVLYFYPRNNTPVCTTQACLFRDAYDRIRSAGAEIIGVSVNTLASHEAFAARHELPFILVSDADGSLHQLYGVGPTAWLIPRRVTFVIDRRGIVRLVCSALFQASRHVDEVLGVLASLQTAEA
jgi:peroxiredoxin Q/BCP